VAAGVLPAAIVLTLNNAPGSAAGYTWTLPLSTWVATGAAGNTVVQTGTTVTSTQPTISIQRPAGSNVGGIVRVNVTGCLATANFVERAINVTGIPSGCSISTYAITRNNSGTSTFAFTLDPTTPCTTALPFGTNIYTWNVMAGAVPDPNIPTQMTSSPTVGFPANIPNPSVIRVIVNDPISCLNMTITTPGVGVRPAPGTNSGGPTPTSGPANSAGALRQALTEALNVFPNPSDQTLNVELPAGKDATLQLIDATGRIVLVQNAESTRATLNVKALPTGQYALRVTVSGLTTYRAVQVRH
jgi:hypothetical protein